MQIELAEDGLKQEESEFNPKFLARLLNKLDWDALRKTAAEASFFLNLMLHATIALHKRFHELLS